MTMVCTKVRYGSKEAARKALRRHKGSFAVMRCYQCDVCKGYWHIGHAMGGR
jgi:hypothetical protein